MLFFHNLQSLAASLQISSCNLMRAMALIQLNDKLASSRKIRNLHRVCGVSGCVGGGGGAVAIPQVSVN